ncbi:hypothetical protein Q3G72_030069 [Acer saccharum]|nr:hypothetical protein Q3G72_030069 [Acer saccharum]
MQAMELGDKCTADKIESLIRNFRPDSPIPISVYVPSFEDTFNPDISPPSFNSDSPAMPRSPKTTSSKRRASRALRESLLDAQTIVDSDVEDHRRDRLLFSPTRPCSFDTELNVVGEGELRKYKSRFDIPDSVTLMLPGDRAVWNPLENAVAIYGAMLNCGAVLEVEAVDRFKRSPAYDALLLREFEKGMRQAKKFFAMKDHSNDKALRHFDRSLQQHMANGVDSIKEQTKRWRAHCRYNMIEPHPMHLEIPSKRAFNTYYSGQKGSFSGSGAEPDLGPVAGRDYEPFMPEEDEEVIWPSEEEIEDEEDSEGPPAAG